MAKNDITQAMNANLVLESVGDELSFVSDAVLASAVAVPSSMDSFPSPRPGPSVPVVSGRAVISEDFVLPELGVLLVREDVLVADPELVSVEPSVMALFAKPGFISFHLTPLFLKH